MARRSIAALALALGAAGCGGEERSRRMTESAPPPAESSAEGAPSPPAAQPSPGPETRIAPARLDETASAARPPAARREEREAMVARQIESRGVKDPRVLSAMQAVPRHEFVPRDLAEDAYADGPLPIGHGQTISQPYIVASMTEELDLQPGERVLEIGTGSGYQAAVLLEITDHVHTIEIVEPLAKAAAERLQRLGYGKVRTRHADGWSGWPEAAPFDAIVVTAAAGQVPPPLVEQLAKGGRMVVPVGHAYAVQTLMLVTKDDKGQVRTRSLYEVRFVPFTRSK